MIADTTAWASLFGAAVGASAVLGGIILSNRREAKRDRKNDQRTLRDQKVERIRADCVILAVAAETFQGVAKQMGALWAEDTMEARAERLNPILAEAIEHLGPALMRLQLETDTEGIAETYNRVWKAIVAFRVGSQMMERSPSYDPKDIVDSLRALEEGVSDIVLNARATLAELETPI